MHDKYAYMIGVTMGFVTHGAYSNIIYIYNIFEF